MNDTKRMITAMVAALAVIVLYQVGLGLYLKSKGLPPAGSQR